MRDTKREKMIQKKMSLPKKLFWCERCCFCLICRCGAAAERVADGEDSKPAEGIQSEEDEDSQGDQGIHDLLF